MESDEKDFVDANDNDIEFEKINYFQSQIFKKEVKFKPEKNSKEKEKIKKLKKLEDKLKCSICNQEVKNPMYDPNCCEHFFCKNCLDTYLIRKYIRPCPVCKKNIRKKNLIKASIIEPIEEKIKEMLEDNDNDIQYEEIEKKCELHPSNEIFFLCLDCQKKMCPICEEKIQHESQNHHLVNYKRYIELLSSFQNNFSNFYQTINDNNNIIDEYYNLIQMLEKQEAIYRNFFNDFIQKIQDIYSKNKENINKYIEESKKTITNLKKFMRNLKEEISSRFKSKYNDIEDIDKLKEEIKQKVINIEIKQLNKNEISNIKNKYINNLFDLPKKQYITALNNKNILENSNLNVKIDDFSFGFELSEDKKTIKVYVDINKIINNKSNDNSYLPFIEYGKNQKKLYLESVEINDIQNSFENTLFLEELFEGKDNVDIKLTIVYLKL